MARIFPEVPLEQDWDAAEMKVYRALEKLPDDYIVFYNVEWLSRGTANPVASAASAVWKDPWLSL